MRKRGILFIICALLITFVSPAATVEAKAKPKFICKSKNNDSGAKL